jgi:hypothetical protein
MFRIYFAGLIHQLLVTMIGRRCSKYINVKRRYFWIDRNVSRKRLHKDLLTAHKLDSRCSNVLSIVPVIKNAGIKHK